MKQFDPKSASALLKMHLARFAAAEGVPDNDPMRLAVGTQMAGRVGRTPVQFGSTTTETDAWIPADVYAQTVFMGLHSQRVLGSLAAAVRVDVQAGEGDTVQVRIFPKRTAQGPISQGTALTDTALGTLTTKSVQIQAYGDYDQLTGQALDFTSDNLKSRLLTEMGAALNEKLEQVLYDVLKNASGTKTRTLDVAGKIDFEEVVKAKAVLRKEKMHPDFLIVGPDFEADLLLDPNLTKSVDYDGSVVALPGEIGRIGSIRILVHELAVASATTAGAVQGILIDSSRAFAEAFGHPLSFEEDRVPESNKWKEVAWVFYGAAVVDPNAICLLKNAA
jgi:N4-gp56 family major capsid protein